MTENCRVKMAISFWPTPPPNFGTASSFPFSVTADTRICWRRRRAITASLLSAATEPSCIFPILFLPFQVYVGMLAPRASPGRYLRAAERTAALLAAVGWLMSPAPRLIISCSSSGLLLCDRAVVSVICFLK